MKYMIHNFYDTGGDGVNLEVIDTLQEFKIDKNHDFCMKTYACTRQIPKDKMHWLQTVKFQKQCDKNIIHGNSRMNQEQNEWMKKLTGFWKRKEHYLNLKPHSLCCGWV